MSSFPTAKRLFHINILTPQPGRLDDFLNSQIASVPRLGDVPGLLESRLFGAEDGTRAVIMSEFESVESHAAFQNSAAFQAERAKLRQLLEGVDARFFRLIQERSFA